MSDSGKKAAPMAVPCRGCVASCPYRERCQGKPWRCLPEGTSSEREKSDG